MHEYLQDAVAGGERAHMTTITSPTRYQANMLGFGSTGELFCKAFGDIRAAIPAMNNKNRAGKSKEPSGRPELSNHTPSTWV